MYNPSYVPPLMLTEVVGLTLTGSAGDEVERGGLESSRANELGMC